jgi:hypothetical protein
VVSLRQPDWRGLLGKLCLERSRRESKAIPCGFSGILRPNGCERVHPDEASIPSVAIDPIFLEMLLVHQTQGAGRVNFGSEVASINL